ncbi:NAD(P)-dependent alcohol dehydrogenase [Agromyces aerolatus]|uniref:NAD(P)-dependent alcohol dehydrogenase n=1 Tax=Agromyces sp. LY-1074 TaxID=3074080 RepID=UPI002855B9E8|nr:MULTISPECIES: NAD(P)-dependent alcohol dehydrogenase [unclassified Agromyces]MDR5701070.1 NAD(P)-dependent alcohol dehydrogenase [Agromyces sp. LY-1074]MDR5707710.1 NAD(P)-dependent alcohol dehydrogenase [Agromyces sp. LY-1358]
MIPERMRAIIQTGYGRPEQVLRAARGPVPVPRLDQVLVKVGAVSINSWDVDLVTGPMLTRVNAPFRTRQRIIGSDVSGEVVAVGEQATRFRVGDRVAGDLSVSGWGGFAEYVAARERALTPVPDEVGDEAACTLPQAGSMALQALGDRVLLDGRRVLIVGAGGGVGTFAIQLAHVAGAHVTVVDRAPKLAALRRLGADEAIEAARLDDVSHPSFDRVVDVVGALTAPAARALLAPGGETVVVGGRPGLLLRIVLGGLGGADRRGRRVGLLIARPNRDVGELLSLVASGTLTPVIDGPHPLADVPHQVERLRAGAVIGKLVIVPG